MTITLKRKKLAKYKTNKTYSASSLLTSPLCASSPEFSLLQGDVTRPWYHTAGGVKDGSTHREARFSWSKNPLLTARNRRLWKRFCELHRIYCLFPTESDVLPQLLHLLVQHPQQNPFAKKKWMVETVESLNRLKFQTRTFWTGYKWRQCEKWDSFTLHWSEAGRFNRWFCETHDKKLCPV